MILEAIVLVKRKDGYFYLDRRGVYKVYKKDFALKRMRVPAVYKGNGYGVALFFRESQVDRDFGRLVWFPDHGHVVDLYRLSDELKKLAIDLTGAFQESDELTFRMLGRGWNAGPRPYACEEG